RRLGDRVRGGAAHAAAARSGASLSDGARDPAVAQDRARLGRRGAKAARPAWPSPGSHGAARAHGAAPAAGAVALAPRAADGGPSGRARVGRGTGRSPAAGREAEGIPPPPDEPVGEPQREVNDAALSYSSLAMSCANRSMKMR